MLTKSANEHNVVVIKNDFSSSKEPHKQTNETTSRDEPVIKSSAQVVTIKRAKDGFKSPVAADPTPSKSVVLIKVTNGTTPPTNTSNAAPTPLTSKKKL